MNMDCIHAEFRVDQQVVYPSQGVGKIKTIETRDFKGNPIPYYVIYFENSDMTSMIPVDKAVKLGVRAIVSQEEAEAALLSISEDYEPVTTDWKTRYQQHLDILKSGDIKGIASIVRSLYHRSKIKELPIMERKLYDSAKKLMEDEIAFSLGKEREEIGRNILSRLDAASPSKKNSESDDFEVEDMPDMTATDDEDVLEDDAESSDFSLDD